LIKDKVFVNWLAMKLPDIPMKTNKKRCIVAYLDSFSLARDLRQARLASLRELQSAAGEESRRRRTLLPSVLRPQGGAFSGKFKGDSHL